MIVAIVKLKIYWRRLAINKYIILNSGKSCEGNEWSSVREKNDEVPRRPLWQGVTEAKTYRGEGPDGEKTRGRTCQAKETAGGVTQEGGVAQSRHRKERCQ